MYYCQVRVVASISSVARADTSRITTSRGLELLPGLRVQVRRYNTLLWIGVLSLSFNNN